MNLKQWLCSSLLVAVSVAPVFANEAAEAKNGPAANTAAAPNAGVPAAASPNPSPNPSPSPSPSLSPNISVASGNAKMAALLNALVTKGVLAPSEANAIRNAAPEAAFQLLFDALNRKGVLSAADLSAAAATTPEPAATMAAPVEENAELTPVRRAGTAEDIAHACSFLVSEGASYITGQVIGVNGGRNT